MLCHTVAQRPETPLRVSIWLRDSHEASLTDSNSVFLPQTQSFDVAQDGLKPMCDPHQAVFF